MREPALRVGIVSSWPRDPARGSGTAMAVRGLALGLERLGHQVIHLRPGGDGHVRLLPRILYNFRLSLRPGHLQELDLLVGVDLDGFLLRPAVPYVVTLKGVAADEALHEAGTAAVGLRIAARLEARNARHARWVVVPSEYAKGVARRLYGIPADRFAVVPEPVMPPRAPAGGDASGLRLWDRPTILSVARQYPRKRTDVLLRALRDLSRRIPEVCLRVVGEGPELPKLRRLADALDGGGRMTFLGAVSEAELAVEYARAHCFCLASEQEAYGIAVVEAMAAGLPVVAARAAALPEIVEDGVNGLLVEPGQAGPLAEALARVLLDPALSRALGDAGR
ncbi:MAG TPA: glycosyltransferase family 4 protein, partial [Longimicrobiales bacterium]|nr:glycosyltransferase family 4 protein [Longimicrobiales bacterium]